MSSNPRPSADPPAKKPLILVADDELRMRRVLVDYLQIKGYDVIEAADGAQALAQFEAYKPDLVLMDVMMPHTDGYEACRQIRHRNNVPIIMLTARTAEEDELEGFNRGADEYIAKPFSLKVLHARIEAVLRRSHLGNRAEAPSDGLVINTDARTVHADGEAVDLTYTEFELLSYLVANAGLALSRDRILDTIWKFDYLGDARTIDTHIKKLRSKLGRQGDYIKTIRGIGYKFEKGGKG